MSILANNLYNLSLMAMESEHRRKPPLPGDVNFSSMTEEGIERLGNLILERFGRSCHDHLRNSDGGIKLLAKTLEGLPQISAPKNLISFNTSTDPDSGMVLFFPGQHGLAHSFEHFATLIDERHSVFACEYEGLDQGSKPTNTMRQTTEKLYQTLDGEHADLFRQLEASQQEVVLFGFCLGSCYAHDMAGHLGQKHDLNIRLVFFDGHPAEWFTETSPRDIFRKSKKALQLVRRKGQIERSLVRQGRRQLHMLSKHASSRVNHPALLIRSNSVGSSWSLCSDAWAPHVRECQHVDCLDLSHLDLMQRRQEARISKYVQPGYQASA